MLHPDGRIVLAAALLLLMNCTPSDDAAARNDRSGPLLVPLDSILLAEADTLYIGYPFGLTIDPFDGSFYVSDTFGKRIHRFARSGALLRTYGRPGQGPGEFNSHSQVAVVDEHTVVAPSMDPPAVYVFGREDGRHLYSVPIPTVLLGTGQPARIADEIWFPALRLDGETTFLVWETKTRTVRLTGSLPEEYRRSREQPGVFHIMRGGGAATAAGDGVLRGWFGLNGLEQHDADGARLSRIEIPVVRRRGVPEGAQQTMDQGRRGPLKTFAAMEEFHSQLRQLGTLPSGEVAFTHHDLHVLEEGGPARETVETATVYVGVLSPDLTRACVDARVPVQGEVRPFEALVGDTLLVLDRRIAAGGGMETWLVAWRVDTSACAWLPVTSRSLEPASAQR